MLRKVPHWTWLIALAVCNLVLWTAVAVTVGLLASDAVDIGVESLARSYQSTAQAALSEWLPRSPAAGAAATAVAHGPEAVATQSAGASVTAAPAPSGSAGQAPAAAEGGQAGESSPGIALTPGSSTADATPPAASTGEAVAPPRVEASVEPTPTLTSRPLVIADPQMDDLAQLDAEMSRSAVGRAVQIRYQETTLNQQVQSLVESSPDLPYEDVTIDLKRGQVVLTAKVGILGFQMAVEVVGTVVARDCVPHLESEVIRVAGAQTSGLVRDAVAGILAEAMGFYPADYPLCLEQIVLEEDRATVYGRRR